MKKLLLHAMFCFIYGSFYFFAGCNGPSKKNMASHPVMDSTSPNVADSTSANVAINSQYLAYENEGEINTDSTLSSINAIKSLSKKQFRLQLKLLKEQQKSCDNGKIIKKPGTFRFSLKGLDFFVKNQKIVGIGSLDLSQDVLNAITEKLGVIDDVLYSYCINLNREFNLSNVSNERIMHLYELQENEIIKLNSIGTTLNQLNQNQSNNDKVKKAVDSLTVNKGSTDSSQSHGE